MQLKMKVWKVYQDFMASKKRILVFRGGTRSTKTHSILRGLLTWLVSWYIRGEKLENGLCSIVRENSATLDTTIIPDWKEVLNTTYVEMIQNRKLVKIPVVDYLSEKKGSKSWSYQWRTIEFRGAQDAQKIKGAKREILYCNEWNELDYDTQFFQLLMRTSKLIIIDLNPDDEEVWINVEIEEKRFYEKWDVEVFVSTYLDNPFLPKAQVEEIEYLKTRDPELWKVYWLGQYWQITGVIFKKWVHYNIIDNVPKEAKLLGYGLDWGFSSDEASIVWVYKYDGKLIIDEIVYQTGLTNKWLMEIAEERGVKKGDLIWADSSEPKSIEEVREELGFSYIDGVKKGAGSINYWIQKLKQYDLLITASSTWLIKELKKYIWLKDKNGKNTKKAIDKFNHSIDAMRYGVVMLLEGGQITEDTVYIW